MEMLNDGPERKALAVRFAKALPRISAEKLTMAMEPEDGYLSEFMLDNLDILEELTQERLEKIAEAELSRQRLDQLGWDLIDGADAGELRWSGKTVSAVLESLDVPGALFDPSEVVDDKQELSEK